MLPAGLALLVSACASSGGGARPTPDGGGAARLELRSCRVAGIDETLRCGELLVPENWDAPAGRRIKLSILVLPALGARRDRPALFDLAGGPGLPASGAAGFYATAGRVHRDGRDVVLVDQRGTGESSPLRCPELELRSLLEEMYPIDAVHRCRAVLSTHADLAQYTTTSATRDLEAVRTVLGYGQIDLFALSYGTRLAQRYLELFPARVHAAVLLGTVPHDARVPLFHAAHAEAVLERLFEQCTAEPACHAAFPELRKEWARVLERVEAGTLTVTVTHQGARQTLELERGPFGEAFRSLLGNTSSQRRVPFLIHALHEGNFAPFAEAVLQGGGALAEGLYLSVTCAEDAQWIDAEAAERATRDTFLGTYRVDQQRSACQQWKVPRVDSSAATGAAPVLLIAGDMDSVTPPDWARAVARSLTSSRVVVIPGLGHFPEGLEAMECLDEMMAAFYEKPEANGVDVSCMARMTRPAFVLEEEEGESR